MNLPNKFKKIIRDIAVTIASIVLIVGLFALYRGVKAGNLSPSAAPAGTMKTLTDIFDSLASGSYDSSGLSADPNGSALEILKCATNKIRGIACP